MIYFFWEGGINENRKRLLRECMQSTKFFNEQEVILISNTLEIEGFKSLKWGADFFKGTPIQKKQAELIMKAPAREQSDLVRLAALYKWGGSYIDTDDICFQPMSPERNIVCRSYDPHTAWYNNVSDEECVSGKWREIRGYDEINMFPRNDCWQNFDRESEFIYDILTDPRFVDSKKEVSICDNFSWQSLTNEYLKKHLPKKEVKYGLTLLYLYESHVAVSSIWDMGGKGEMFDLLRELPDYSNTQHGEYRCTRDVAELFLEKLKKYPYLSHLWLHDKDMNPDWLRATGEKERLSTWIINIVREKCSL